MIILALSVALGFILMTALIVSSLIRRHQQHLPFYYLIAAMLEAVPIPAYVIFSLGGLLG